MNKKRIIDRIIELYTHFRVEVETYNKANLFDINIYSETVLIPLLNAIYGLNLKDANFEEKNFSAVDLIDKENRVAIQVTSTASGEKIKHTLKTYLKDRRYEDFDNVLIYILTAKQKKYSDKTFKNIIDGKFEFESSKNIIDSSDVINEIKSWISIPRAIDFKDLLEEQFSSDAQEGRKYYLENKDTLDSQIIYPNILKIILPKNIYVGKLNINREEIVKRSWETDFKLKFTASLRKIIKSHMHYLGIEPSVDWHEFENNLITFKNLNDVSEPLSKLVELGSVEVFTVKEFFDSGENYKTAFARLVNLSFTELLKLKNIAWLPKDKIYRFSSSVTRKITWKNKKTATRTVVKELWNKEKNRILAFQHQAFALNVFYIDGTWFLSVKPTYSITYDGKRTHGKAGKFIDSQKRLDKNQTVYNHFKFITYCLRNKIKEDEKDYPYINVDKAIKLNLTFKKNF
ncbi:SMEK domain-containing protein [Leptobacterium flavescens]|uniref:SMEK domain-containing protein n=1 Tax=Leptobacterium flavescens TaxID=472055 RepID=A0A6P0UJ29_9FLAO|nr:SMEK domain-containing protein [Leptobacterium flavescens]NER13381.1 SMEK domain-containing protein [Leptobacterium flavescens]